MARLFHIGVFGVLTMAVTTALAMPLGVRMAMWGRTAFRQAKLAVVSTFEDAFSGSGEVTLDDGGNIVVTLTNDVSGTVEMPDNVGNVAIDLNGHDMVGDGGHLGEAALPGGPAIRIVAGDGEGTTTHLAIGDTSAGEKGQIAGGGENAGIAFAEDVAPGVRLEVEDDVAVLNGDGSEQDWRELSPVEVTLTVGEYFKTTLAELGYDVPTDGTAYTVKAYGLPAGLKLVGSKAVTKKVGKKTVVVTPANVEWWIEGVPTAAMDFFENPPYLVITANGETVTEPLPIEVMPQKVVDLNEESLWGELSLGESLTATEPFYLPGVGAGWTVTGLPTGLKYTAKLLTTKKMKGKKVVSVTTNALPYSVYGKTTKVGLFTITAKKKVGAYYETMKYRVLVLPKAPDTALFGEELTNITTMAYVPVEWDLVNGGEWDGGHAGRVTLPAVAAVGGKVAKVSGLPTGLTFAAADTYKDKKKTQVKQYGQTIVGTPTKPGTYVVTFTKNVKNGKKTVAKTAQILWTVVVNDAELELGFNKKGGVIESGVVGLNYGELMAFTATSNATVTASGLPVGIKLVRLDGEDGHAGRVTLPGYAAWGFEGFTAKAGTYLVTVKATLNGKTVTQRIALKVDGLPSWAKGTYNGNVECRMENGELGEGAGETTTTNGLATVTVSAAGKISGKFTEFGTNWTLSAASYTGAEAGTRDACPYQAFECSNVVAKYSYKVKSGKKTVTKTLTRSFELTVEEAVTRDACPYRGVVRLVERLAEDGSPHQTDDATEIETWQNLWGSSYKALGKALFYTSKKNQYKVFAQTVEVDGKECTLSLKITAAGAVTATLTYDTGKTKKDAKTKKMVKVYYKPTCSTVVIPTSTPDAETFTGKVPLYFAPSAANGFAGYSAEVDYPF